MKKLIVMFFLLGFVLELSAQNYFPLNKGNVWQYLLSGNNSSGSSYSLKLDSVEYNSVINGNVYFKLYNSNDLLRYSVSENKIFTYYNDSEYVYVDFNIPTNNYYQSFGYWHYYANALSII